MMTLNIVKVNHHFMSYSCKVSHPALSCWVWTLLPLKIYLCIL